MKFRAIFILTLLFLGTGHNVQAAMMNGKVDSYDPSTRKVTLSSQDPVSGRAVKTEVWLDSNVKAEGLVLPAGLRTGDSVWIDAELDSEGNLRAGMISKA